MNIYDLIFTGKKPQRYIRHIVFWFFYFIKGIFFLFMAGMTDGAFFTTSKLAFNLKVFSYFFVTDILFVFVVVYLLIPGFFARRKYAAFFSLLLFLFLISYFGFFAYINWFYNRKIDSPEALFGAYFHDFMLMLFSGPQFPCFYYIAVKSFKNYYLRMQEREVLAKENSNAELQLLKAQVHPHFLFNTLNNIYSFTLDRSAYAENLVEHLSNTMKYMITECDESLVPLAKELKMIDYYISLEKVRYGNRLQVDYEISGESENKSIAPLLLIPFVENSFKHGTSKMLEHPWIKLRIDIDDGHVNFSLSNSMPVERDKIFKGGIGLKNVKKRLAILYPNQFSLTIGQENKSFTVTMRLPVQYELSNKYLT